MTVYGYGGSTVFAANDVDGEEWSNDLSGVDSGVTINDISYHPDGGSVMAPTDSGLYQLDPQTGDASTISSSTYDRIVCGPSYCYLIDDSSNIERVGYDGTVNWETTVSGDSRDLAVYLGTRRRFVTTVGSSVVRRYDADAGTKIDTLSITGDADVQIEVNQNGEIFPYDDDGTSQTTLRIDPQFTVDEKAGAEPKDTVGERMKPSESILVYNKGSASIEYHDQQSIGSNTDETQSFDLSSDDYTFGGVCAGSGDTDIGVGYEDTSGIDPAYGVIFLDENATETGTRYEAPATSDLSDTPRVVVSDQGENGANPYYTRQSAGGSSTAMRTVPQNIPETATGLVELSATTPLSSDSVGTSQAYERTLTPIAVLPNAVDPDSTVAFEGEVVLDGSAVEGARILAVETTSDTVVDTTKTDANGQYATRQLTLDDNIYHVIVQYDDGTDRYNAPSKPYLG